MKKLLLVLLLFLSAELYSQINYIGNIDTNKIRVSSLNPETISSLAVIYQYYEAWVYCDSVLKYSVGDSLFTSKSYSYTSRSEWNYLGRFKGSDDPDMWIKKAYPNTTAVPFMLRLYGVK